MPLVSAYYTGQSPSPMSEDVVDRRLQLQPLADHPELLDASIQLLNEEWPRSYGSRLHSQEKSARRSPPMSLLLIDVKEQQLVGHSRICLLPTLLDACWIESVIIRKSQRGLGLGRVLMSETERQAKELGFRRAFLCTEDKRSFYERIGYALCAPILHSTADTRVLAMTADLFIQRSSETSDTTGERLKPSASSGCEEKRFNGAPPPPPPPPPPSLQAGTALSKKTVKSNNDNSSSNNDSTILHDVEYMCKNLVDCL